MPEIRVYCEGGGDGKDTRAAVRSGFQGFLSDLRELARAKGARWRLIACGGRDAAFAGYSNARRFYPNALNILLVDSEGPVQAEPWRHLSEREPAWTLMPCDARGCHLMVQAMEAWFIADIDALRRFYGVRFNANPIPRRNDVEQIDKAGLAPALVEATRNSQKGPYHKIRHAPKLLELIDPGTVQRASAHCRQLFNTVTKFLEEDT